MATSVDPAPSELTTLSPEADSTDLENESRSDFNVRQSAGAAPTVKKQLFQTPATTHGKMKASGMTPRTPAQNHDTPASSFLTGKPPARHITRDSNHLSRTPAPVTPGPVSTARRRPHFARIASTPGMRRRYVSSAPEMWRECQKRDLTAWLNSELVDASVNSSYTAWEDITSSVVFLKQFVSMRQLYKSVELQNILRKVDREIDERRFFVSRSKCLRGHVHVRDDISNLLLHSYHPIWLLLGLWVVLGLNFGPLLDDAIAKAKQLDHEVDIEAVLTAVLQHAISTHLLCKKQSVLRSDVRLSADKRRDVRSQERDDYNGKVLSRILHLVLLLDKAKQSSVPIISTDPPLFRYSSETGSSEEIIQYLGREYLQEQGDVVKFLQHREYRVRYEAPILERMGSLMVKDVCKDLSDGTRLCKLASVMVKDRSILHSIRRIKSGMTRQQIRTCHIGNVNLALSTIQQYVVERTHGPFEWKGTHQDLVDGDVDRTIAVLWQIVSLWLEVVVLDENNLQKELKVVQQQFREARLGRRETWSPGSLETTGDMTLRKVSPTRLTVFENCESESSTLLLKWCATVAGIYGVAVRDYTESFRDGAVLCLLLHHYYPNLVQIGEITRVKLAELRSVNDAEAESILAKKNFELFTSRSRRLGNIPYIPISVQAALAPSFSCAEKEESFGRLMEVLCSYIFRRLILEKEHGSGGLDVNLLFGTEELIQFEEESASNPSYPGSFTSRVARLVPEMTFVSVPDSASRQEGVHPGSVTLSDKDRSVVISRTLDSVISRSAEQGSHSVCLDGSSSGSQIVKIKTPAGATDHEDFTLGSPEKTVVTLSAKEQAALTILRYYRGWKSKQSHEERRRCALLVQTAYRGLASKVTMKEIAEKSRLRRSRESNVPNASSSGKCSEAERISKLNDGDSEETAVREIDLFSTGSSDVPGLLERVSGTLLALSSCSQSAAVYIDKMESHEKNIAANLLQQSYRSYASRRALNQTRDESRQRQTSMNSFQLVLSSIPQAAASFADRIAKEAEKRRQAQIAVITAALQKAEQACEKELQKQREARHSQNERLRKGLSARFEEEQAKQHRENRLQLEADLQKLDDEIREIDGRIDEDDAFVGEFHEEQGLRLNQFSGWNEASGTSNEDRIANEITSANAEELDKGVDGMNLEEARECERKILTELGKLHDEWDTDLAVREASLRKKRDLLMSSLLHLAEWAFDMHMWEAKVARESLILNRRQYENRLQNLDHEEQNALGEHSNLKAEVTESISSLQSQVSGSIVALECLTDTIEDKCGRLDEDLAFLSELQHKVDEAERAWNSSTASFDTDTSQVEAMFASFEDWRRDADENDSGEEDINPSLIDDSEVAHPLGQSPCDRTNVDTRLGTFSGEGPEQMDKSSTGVCSESVLASSQPENDVYVASQSAASNPYPLIVAASPLAQYMENSSASFTDQLRPPSEDSEARLPRSEGLISTPLGDNVLSSIENRLPLTPSTSEASHAKPEPRANSKSQAISAEVSEFKQSFFNPIPLNAEVSPRRVDPVSTTEEFLDYYPSSKTGGELALSASGAALEQLSQELNDLRLETPTIDKVQEILESPVLSQKLDSVLRRLSSALASPAPLAGLDATAIGQSSEARWELNLTRTIFIIIRQCARTQKHLALVRSGVSIIKDFTADEERIDYIVSVEDCVEVLVTCIQFYRDDEEILTFAMEALIALSWHPLVAADLRADDGVKRRLLATCGMMQLELRRKSKHLDRLRRTEVIMNAISLRREHTTEPFSLAAIIEEETRRCAQSQDEVPASLILFEKLLSRFTDRKHDQDDHRGSQWSFTALAR